MIFYITPTETERDRARTLVLRYGWNTMAYQILNPGISLWFSKYYDAVIGYVSTHTHVIVAGSPIAQEEQLDNLVLEFYEYVSAQKKKVCFFGAQERIASILARYAPVSSILLGAQPVWSPEAFLHTIHTKPSLRAQVHRAMNKYVTAELWDEQSGIPKEALTQCLSEWLSLRHLPPMHFLVESNTLDGLDDRRVVVARIHQTIIGFCIASPIPLRKGWLIEQIVRGKNAPNGTVELMLERMTAHLQSLGTSLVTLGLSPLSRHYTSSFIHPLWLNAALTLTRYYGRSFYNFDGLDAFKAKFLPEAWEPVYAVTNEESPAPLTLYAIATAFSGMSPVTFVWKGLLKKMLVRDQSSTD
jgi:phosphatidylglycerol lysyltransferase